MHIPRSRDTAGQCGCYCRNLPFANSPRSGGKVPIQSLA